ncbi:hypothetical protein [Pengzhenrongella sicca]|uniref:DUF5648 domain-containing protein n=1 Tax=Pengzhenrongella sicca TaxID=2819238 RepID=A0A8A4ZG38_9MICO|nr:hypothetical protein [Pengzhenrongella sicca]QTE30245.1 hypothetical protein J4E96_04355 [Pengzhenrongella sicca]
MLTAAAIAVGLAATTAAADTEILLDPVAEAGTTPALDIVRYQVSLDAAAATSTVYFQGWDQAALDAAEFTTVLVAGDSVYEGFVLFKGAGSPSAILTTTSSSDGGAIPGCPVTVTYSAARHSVEMSVSAGCLGDPAAVSLYHVIDLNSGASFDFADSNPFGPSRAVSAGPVTGLPLPIVTVQRFWSEAFSNAHFFTADPTEAENLFDNDANWSYESLAFSAYAPEGQVCSTTELTPVYRFYSQRFQSHFFTADGVEKDTLRAGDSHWAYEGVAYCAPAAPATGTEPLFRFWSSRFGKHFYTADPSEAHLLRTADPNWAYEGVAYDVLA